MPNTDPLILSKLHPPFLRKELIDRSRLQLVLQRGLSVPLTLVTAPAGFGKTTLTASFLHKNDLTPAWFSLDQNDNTPVRFFTYFASALNKVDGRLGIDALQLLAGLTPALSNSIVVSLINDLEQLDHDIVLVLDDYQHIHNPEIHQQISFLLEHCPARFHLFVTSRSDPPFAVARMRARAQVVEIRATDLRFTEMEASEFLRQIMGLDLDEGMVGLLEQRTEGWIAGLQMAAVSMRDLQDTAGFIAGFSGTNRHILDYLLEEVLASQPEAIQDFLLRTSILDRLNPRLCDFLMVETPGQKRMPSSVILQQLESENIFCNSMDDHREWYRYHQLFSDLLQARLKQTQPDLIPQLHDLAAEWLEQNGYITEAVSHLLNGQKYDLAMELIEKYVSRKWLDNDLSVLQMVDLIPQQTLLSHPRAGIYYCWMLINQGKIDKAYPLLLAMESSISSAPAEKYPNWLQMVVRLALAFLVPPNVDFPAAQLPPEDALDLIPPEEQAIRDSAEILYGMALGRRGSVDQAAEFSWKSIQADLQKTGSKLDPSSTTTTLIPYLATLYLFQGKLRAAESICSDYTQAIQERGIRLSTSGNMAVVLGNVYYEHNQLDEAERLIKAGLKANEPWQNIMTDAFGSLELIHVLIAKRNFTEAMQLIDKFLARLQGPSLPIEFIGPVMTIKTEIQLAMGDLINPARWADTIQRTDEYKLMPSLFLFTLAHLYKAQKKYSELESLLSSTSLDEQAGNRLAKSIEKELLLACALTGLNRQSEACQHLAKALELAQPEGYLRVMLDGGPMIRDLLNRYVKDNPSMDNGFAHQVLIAFASGNTVQQTGMDGLIEPLSIRENEVLRLMAQGMTNEQIAVQLVVARGTIKAHAASIFRKLNANNRTEAVSQARAIGLLDLTTNS